MTAGGWSEPDMVIKYTKDYGKDQEDIIKQMENDYLKGADVRIYQDKKELLRIVRDHPELISKMLEAII